jgi:hypothetical protein
MLAIFTSPLFLLIYSSSLSIHGLKNVEESDFLHNSETLEKIVSRFSIYNKMDDGICQDYCLSNGAMESRSMNKRV